MPFSDDPDVECFPDEIKEQHDLLAANINELGQDYAVVKIVARMLNLRVDELWQRYRIAEDRKKQRLKEERANLLKMQSYYLAEKSVALHHAGKYDLARRLALLALPQDKEFEERPYVSEADDALRLSYAGFKYIFNGSNGCVSPDGEWIAVVNGALHDSVILYSTDSGNVVHEFSGYGDFLSVSFSCDSKSIACGTRNGTICMWDIASGTCTGKLEIGFTVVSLAFNPDMKHLVASLRKDNYQSGKIPSLGDRNNSLITVSLGTFELEREWLLGEFEEAPKVVFSHTGKYLVTVTHNEICIKVAASGKIVNKEHDVRYVSFSEDDRYFVYGFGHCIPFVDTFDGRHTRIYRHYDVSFASFCGSTDFIMAVCDDYAVRVWRRSLEEGRIDLVSILKGHSRPIKWAAATENGSLVATCSEDNTVRVWSVKDARCISSAHCENPEEICFLANEQFLAITTKHGIRLWKYMEDGLALKLEGHREGVVSLYFSRDSSMLLTGSSDAELLFWDWKNGACRKIGLFEKDQGRLISSVLGEDHRYAALLCEDAFTIWNIEDRKCVCRCGFEENIVRGAILLDEKDGGFIVTTGSRILHFDLDGSFHVILSSDQVFDDDYGWMEFSSHTAIDPKSGLLACGMEIGPVENNFPVCLFDRDGKIHRIMKGHMEAVGCLGFDAEGHVISATEDGEVKWWNTMNGVCEKTLRIDGKMHSLGFYGGELRLIYEKDGAIVLDDCATRRILCDSSNVNVVTFNSDGTLISIGCGVPYPLYDKEGLLIDKRTDSYVQVIVHKSLHEMIRYVREQCKNLSFTSDERRIYYL